MLIQKVIIINDKEYQKTYSDMNIKIKQVETGIIYDDAIDVMPCRFTYEETDIPIPEFLDNTDYIISTRSDGGVQ